MGRAQTEQDSRAGRGAILPLLSAQLKATSASWPPCWVSHHRVQKGLQELSWAGSGEGVLGGPWSDSCQWKSSPDGSCPSCAPTSPS